MEFKRLGKNGLEVSAIGLGTAFRSGLNENSLEVIKRAVNLGITLIDTAEVYHGGRSEEVVGNAIKDRRDEVVIVTKVRAENLRYEDVLKASEGSLKRLGIKTIDLYLIHWPNPSIPINETMRAMEKLIDEGKVRYIGVSNFNVTQVKEAQEALSRYEIIANQVEYNLIKRDIEADLLPYCMRENIGVIAYSPLARGLLTGKFDEGVEMPIGHWRTRDPLFQGENFARGLEVVRSLRMIGAVHKRTPAQVAINWLVAKPGVVALFGASSTDQVEEICGAVGWRLTREDLETIDSLSGQFKASGKE